MIYYALVILLVVAFFYFIRFFDAKQVLIRKYKNSGQKKIAEFQSGDIGFVTGSVTFNGSALKSPLSGKDCVFYSINSYFPSRRDYELIKTDTQASTILINDGTGYALIKPAGMKNHLSFDAVYRTWEYTGPEIRLDDYLLNQQIDRKGVFGFKKGVLVEEYILTENKKICVEGKATWQKASTLGLSLPEDKVLVFEVTGGAELKIFDLENKIFSRLH
jgi:hypothetical protein